MRGGRENQKPQRQRRDAVVTGQLRHEGGHFGIGHRGMVADCPHLGGLRQQLVQVTPPAGRVQRVAVLTSSGIVEDVFDAGPHPLGGFGLADPEWG